MSNSFVGAEKKLHSFGFRVHKFPPFRLFPLKRLEVALLLLLSTQTDLALSNPASEKVVSGTATFQRSSNTLTINQTSDRAIINWKEFSIGGSELARFIQPNALSAVLNRVVSGNPSALLGKLEANGKVFLINPNGVLIGSGAAINTNSFIASTLDVRDSQFLVGGDLNFSGGSNGAIQNLGKIHAQSGDVFLIAHTVSNAGVIEASKGVVGLAASNDVVLKNSADERLFVQASLGTKSSAEAGVSNDGLILAVQAEMRAAGGNVYGLAVNNSGTVRVTGITEKDGRILLTSSAGNLTNSGSLSARNANGDGATVRLAAGHDVQDLSAATNTGVIDASGRTSGSKGGMVIVTGDKVSLGGNASINASGDSGGGAVLIGGDYRGENAAISNAHQTLIGKDSRVSADAITNGNGGKVIVWANHSTEFDGYISARGGARGGDGGLVETSAKILQISAGARVDAGASAGLVGQWLLDPLNVTIVDIFTGTTNGGFSGGAPNVYTPTGNNATVDASTISSALTNGTSVTITTGGAAAGSQSGNIQVNSGIFVNSTAALPTLTLNADNQVVINAAIQGNPGSMGLNLIVNANDAISVTSQANLFLVRNGTFTAGIKNPAQSSSGGIAINGTVTANAVGNSAADKIVLQAAGDITGSGSLSAVNAALNSSAGSVNFGGGLTANLLTAAALAGTVTINNPTNVNLAFLGTVNSSGAININNTGNGGSALNIVGAVSAGAGNPLKLTNSGAIFIDNNGVLGKGTGTLNNPTGTITLTARSVSDSANAITPSIAAAALAISAQQGIGSSSSNPLYISVANLEALTPASGIFVKNSGKELTIGGVSSPIQGGVLTGLTNGGEIQIVNDRGILLTAAGNEKAHVAGPQNILIQANGTVSDIVVGDSSLNAVNAHSGNITLNAGRDLVIGRSGLLGNVSGATVNLNAGHAVVLDEGSIVTGSSGINATAGTVVPSTDGRPTSIVFYQTAVAGTRLVTSGAAISLSTAPGGFVDAHSGAALAASSAGGVINFRTDDVLLSSPFDAGTGYVQFLPASGTRSIDIGSKTVGKLSLTNTELGLVRAGTVVIGDAANRTDVSITAPINITTFGALGLQALGTSGNGNMIAAALTVPFLEIQASNSITGSGAINAINKLTLSSDSDRIILSGPVKTAGLIMSAAGTINVDSLANQISELGDIKRGGQLTIRNTVPLSIRGYIAGTNTANDVTIRTVGDITMNGAGSPGFSGANVVVSGARNEAVLEAGNGHFVNNAASTAIDAQSGARFRVYSADNSSPYTKGSLQGVEFNSNPVGYPNDPNASASTFYFGSLVTTGNSVSGGTVAPSSPVTAGESTTAAPDATAAKGGDTNSGSSSRTSIETIMVDGRLVDISIRPYQAFLTTSPAATVDQAIDPLSQAEHVAEDRGSYLVSLDSAKGEPYTAELLNSSKALVAPSNLRYIRTILNKLERGSTDPWRLIATGFAAVYDAAPGLVLATSNKNTHIGRLNVVWATDASGQVPDPEGVAVPPGGSVRILNTNEGNVMGVFDADGRQLSVGYGNLISIGSGNSVDNSSGVLTTVASSRITVEKAETYVAGKSAVLSSGQRVLVPGGAFTPVPTLQMLLANPMAGSIAYRGLGQTLNDAQIGSIANIVASGGGNLTREDVAVIVAAGGGNFTPGVVSAIIAAGGGNMGPTNISNIIAAGGGNLADSTAMISIVSASIVAQGGGNIVAQGGGNLNSQIANIIAAGGGNISASGVAQIIAAGGGNIIASGGGNIIASGGGNLLSLAVGIVAAGGGNVTTERASSIIASGGGNFYSTVNTLIGAGGGNVISPNGSNIIAQGGGNVISPNGSNIIAQGGGNVISPNGSNIIAQGGGNVISPNGSNIIAQGGGNVISPNGSNIIAQGGGNVISPNGSNIIAQGGGNVISPNGSNIIAQGGGNVISPNGSNIIAQGGGNVISPNGSNITATGGGNIIPSLSFGSNFINH